MFFVTVHSFLSREPNIRTTGQFRIQTVKEKKQNNSFLVMFFVYASAVNLRRKSIFLSAAIAQLIRNQY